MGSSLCRDIKILNFERLFLYLSYNKNEKADELELMSIFCLVIKKLGSFTNAVPKVINIFA